MASPEGKQARGAPEIRVAGSYALAPPFAMDGPDG